jgi:hypothetical protein
MSLIALVTFACVGSFAVAGLALAVYASLPEKFLNHADLGRYAGLAATPAKTPANRVPTVGVGPLENQSA